MAVWNNDEMFVKECGVCGKTKYSVFVPSTMHNMFLTLLKHIKTEWIMYLTYDKETKTDKKGVVTDIIYKVSGYRIPEQEVGHATAKPLNASEIEELVQSEIPDHGPVGVIHAHQFTHNHKPNFSGVDDNHVNGNNAFSLVISGDGEYEAVAKEQTECGRWIIKECKVYEEFIEHPTIVDELKALIKTKVYNYNNYGYEGFYGNRKGAMNNRPFQGANQRQGGSSNVWGENAQTREVPVSATERRVTKCPSEGTDVVCEVNSYYDCEYYNPNCPKKEGSSPSQETSEVSSEIPEGVNQLPAVVDTQPNTEQKSEEEVEERKVLPPPPPPSTRL